MTMPPLLESHEVAALAALYGSPMHALLQRFLADADRALRVTKEDVAMRQQQGRAQAYEDLLRDIERCYQGRGRS